MTDAPQPPILEKRRPAQAAALPRPNVPLSLQLIQLVLCLMAAYTIYLGSLALYAGLIYGVTADQRDNLYTNVATPGERKDLAKARAQIIPVWDAWLPYDDLAQIAMADAYDAGINKPEGRKLMPEVLRLETEALTRNPANAYAWMRLAFARYIYNGPSRLVAEPLVQSIQAAPYEPPLLAARVVLALRIEKYWTPELADLFPQQLERAWLRESVDTVRAAYQDGIEAALREKLADDPVKRAAFDRILADIRPK